MNTISWDSLEFLLGEWTGAGGGAPGQGEGTLVFHFDLQKQVLLRRNHVNFPATLERPAFAHDDLTVIYQDPVGCMRAVYFDNEKHVIHYSVTIDEDEDEVMFVSEAVPSEPRFRTTYLQEPDGSLAIHFEIAPPGNPGGFSVYTEGNVIRKS
jgi:hypothetical protein